MQESKNKKENFDIFIKCHKMQMPKARMKTTLWATEQKFGKFAIKFN